MAGYRVRAVIRWDMSLSRQLARLLELRSLMVITLVFLERRISVDVASLISILLAVPVFNLVVT